MADGVRELYTPEFKKLCALSTCGQDLSNLAAVTLDFSETERRGVGPIRIGRPKH
jgi:hypothetical protein